MAKSNYLIMAMVFLLSLLQVNAADTTIVDWGTGVSGGIGTAKVTSDGTSATLTVDKIKVEKTGSTMSNLTVNGTLTLGGTAAIAGTSSVSSSNAVVGGTLTVNGTGLITGTVIRAGTTLAVAGRAAATATGLTGVMLDYGRKVWDAGQGVSVTQAYTTVYSSEPRVIIQYAGDTVSASGAFTGLVDTATNPGTNFIVTLCETTFVWQVMGLK